MQQNKPTAFPQENQASGQTTGSAVTEIEKSRAVQETQAALVIAKKFPRDEIESYNRIMKSCSRITLASQSMYSYPRGKEMVTGPSIRMAEVLAQNWRNVEFGIRELERRDEVSIAESYCWDMETNVRQKKVFEVPHFMQLRGGQKKRLTDPRDIYELVANHGARRLRQCILGIIPIDIVEDAVERCKKTVAEGTGEPIENRVRRMIGAFSDIGVSQDMLERRLGHKMDLTTTDEIVELTSIYTAIKDKQANRQDFFDFGKGAAGGEDTAGPAADLIKTLESEDAQKAPEKPAAADERKAGVWSLPDEADEAKAKDKDKGKGKGS
jgi:hypothetical protein